MFAKFFTQKSREVLNYLHIMRRKVTDNDEVRNKGSFRASSAIDEENRPYLKEIKNKTDNESGRDISAI